MFGCSVLCTTVQFYTCAPMGCITTGRSMGLHRRTCGLHQYIPRLAPRSVLVISHSSSTTRPMADDKVKDTMETPVFINVIFVFFRVLQTHCCQLEFWLWQPLWREKKIPDSFNTKQFPDLFSAFPDLFRIFFLHKRRKLQDIMQLCRCQTLPPFSGSVSSKRAFLIWSRFPQAVQDVSCIHLSLLLRDFFH